MKTFKPFFLIIAVLTFLIFPDQPNALFHLPDNLGIDYKTMTIATSLELKQAGMRDVRIGDPVIVEPADKSGLKITNQRTGETVLTPSSPIPKSEGD